MQMAPIRKSGPPVETRILSRSEVEIGPDRELILGVVALRREGMQILGPHRDRVGDRQFNAAAQERVLLFWRAEVDTVTARTIDYDIIGADETGPAKHLAVAGFDIAPGNALHGNFGAKQVEVELGVHTGLDTQTILRAADFTVLHAAIDAGIKAVPVKTGFFID